jgi:hypothetical protein
VQSTRQTPANRTLFIKYVSFFPLSFQTHQVYACRFNLPPRPQTNSIASGLLASLSTCFAEMKWLEGGTRSPHRLFKLL